MSTSSKRLLTAQHFSTTLEVLNDVLHSAEYPSSRDVAPKDVALFLIRRGKSLKTAALSLVSALLVAVSAILGNGVRVRKDRGRLGTANLYLIGVGVPGCGKTAAWTWAAGDPLRELAESEPRLEMLRQFTGPAMLKEMDRNKGSIVIGSGEVAGPLLTMLQRGSKGESSSGERDLLLDAWDGCSLTTKFATKEGVKIERATLTVGGFTQPSQWVEVMEEVGPCNRDGLYERLLFCPVRVPDISKRGVAAASTAGEAEYPGSLWNLVGLLRLICQVHGTDMTYEISPAAAALLDEWDDGVRLGQKDEVIVPAAYSDTEDEDEASASPPGSQPTVPIRTKAGTKLTDHIVKVALNMHVLYAAMEALLQGNGAPFAVTPQIDADTIKRAAVFVRYCLHATETYLEGVEDVRQGKRQVPMDGVGAGATDRLARDALVTGGLAVTRRQLMRKKRCSAGAVDETFQHLERRALGKIVMFPRGMAVFYKTLPGSLPEPGLAMFGVSVRTYQESLSLPASDNALGVTALLARHPARQEATAYLRTLRGATEVAGSASVLPS